MDLSCWTDHYWASKWWWLLFGLELEMNWGITRIVVATVTSILDVVGIVVVTTIAKIQLNGGLSFLFWFIMTGEGV